MREIDPKLQMLFDQMPGAWGCKDENSTFIYANEEYTRIVGMKNKDDIKGMTDFDMPCDTTNCASMFRLQDKEVMLKAKAMRILDIHPFAGYEWKAYIFTKTPLYDDNKDIIGTIFHGADVTNTSTIEIGSILSKMRHEDKDMIMNQNSFLIGNSFDKISLTPKQSEVLFFLLRGKTAKQIATILKRSMRTIEEHLESLKTRFNSLNRYELIDKAIELGFLNTIPESLFNTQLSVVLKN